MIAYLHGGGPLEGQRVQVGRPTPQEILVAEPPPPAQVWHPDSPMRYAIPRTGVYRSSLFGPRHDYYWQGWLMR